MLIGMAFEVFTWLFYFISVELVMDLDGWG
jgi:hypothetical protein